MAVKKLANKAPPIKYIPEIIYPKIREYLSMCGKEQTTLPSIEGLALHLDVNPDTINDWSKKYPELSVYIKKVATKQRQQLMDDGMYGGKEVNASMAIFLLKAIHKFKDTPQVAIQFNSFVDSQKNEQIP